MPSLGTIARTAGRAQAQIDLMLELRGVNLGDNAIILGEVRFIEDVRSRGGQGFVERVGKYGRNEQDKPIRLRQWYAQTLRLTGDWRLRYLAVSGASQTGKSLAVILAYVDLGVIGRMPVGYAYASADALDKYSPTQFRPILLYYLRALEEVGIKISRRSDRKTNELYQAGGVSFNFSFASTSKTTASNEGKPIIAGTGSTYPAASVCHDERSRFPHGVDFSARVGSSPIPSQPIRDCGTKGGGAGIEVFLDKCDRIFTQHYHCSACGAIGPLDVLGCLLVETETVDSFGRKTVDYFGEDGRPLDWWHTDPNDRVKTAAVCCPKCKAVLDMKDRVEKADMRCKLTGVKLEDYLDSITGYDWSEKVGVDLSPLCRENSENIAATLIDKCLTAENPQVVMQEDLGIVSISKSNRLSMQMLRPLIGAPAPEEKEQLFFWRTIAGLDQGRGQHWLWVMRVYARSDWRRMRWDQFRQTCIRKVVYGGKVHVHDIEEKLEQYQVDFGLIDSEPETTWAAALCDRTCLELADQVNTLDDFKKGTVRSGGEEFECWKISTGVFARDVFDAAAKPMAWDGRPPYRFPKQWSRYDNVLNETSPFRHLMGPSFDPIEERWKRPKDRIDDIFFSGVFSSAAMAIAFDRGPTWHEVDY